MVTTKSFLLYRNPKVVNPTTTFDLILSVLNNYFLGPKPYFFKKINIIVIVYHRSYCWTTLLNGRGKGFASG